MSEQGNFIRLYLNKSSSAVIGHMGILEIPLFYNIIFLYLSSTIHLKVSLHSRWQQSKSDKALVGGGGVGVLCLDVPLPL